MPVDKQKHTQKSLTDRLGCDGDGSTISRSLLAQFSYNEDLGRA